MRELGLTFIDYVKHEYPENLGKRSKLGGIPEWVHEEEKVTCLSCKNEMKFVSQLDSIDYTGEINKNAEYIFGDVGVIYTFFCFECLTVKSILQSY